MGSHFMMINPGTYHVFNPDGSLFKWGEQSTHVEVTTSHRIRFYVGDDMEPITERIIPRKIQDLDKFNDYTLNVYAAAMVLYVSKLITQLHKLKIGYQQILDQRRQYLYKMLADEIPVWLWREKYIELNTYQETCEDLMLQTLGKIHALTPEMHLIVFTEK